MRCTKTYDKENKKPVVHQYLSRVKDWLCLIDAHIVGELFFFIIVSLWYNRDIKILIYLSQFSIIPDISRKIAVSTLRFRLLSLVFALIRQNKGKLFFFTRRPPYPAVLLRSVLLPLSRVRRYSSWYSHPHVPAVPERPSAVRR